MPFNFVFKSTVYLLLPPPMTSYFHLLHVSVKAETCDECECQCASTPLTIIQGHHIRQGAVIRHAHACAHKTSIISHVHECSVQSGLWGAAASLTSVLTAGDADAR